MLSGSRRQVSTGKMSFWSRLPGLRTGVPVFLGYAGEADEQASRGLALNTAKLLTMWPQFGQHFELAGLAEQLSGLRCHGFFENGGSCATCVRLDDSTSPADSTGARA